MTEGQKAAFDRHWPKYGLELSDGALSTAEAFGRVAPLVLEIGFGMGQSLLDMAIAAPENDFIGIEVHTPGVGRLLNGIDESGISNVRVYKEDAVEVLNVCIADNSLDRVQIYFPDPWHKKKHHKRRLIQPSFVAQLAKKMKSGGVLHLATDWENYAEHMLEVLNDSELENLSATNSWCERPEWRPLTKFEKRGQRLGHGVWDLLYRK